MKSKDGRFDGLIEAKRKIIEPKPPTLSFQLAFAYGVLLISIAVVVAFLVENKH